MVVSLGFCLVMVILLCICIVNFLYIYSKLRRQFDALLSSYHSLERLNAELRSQRHDYLNHLQVVYGLMELEEYGELKDYLSPIYRGMMKTGKALKTSVPALNALLRAKMAEAEKADVDFYIEVSSKLSVLPLESWELCKVLANILDNGLTALEEKKEEKKLRLSISEDHGNYHFIIGNNGPLIPPEQRELIFREGWSSKKEAGHGMGLAIVQRVLNSCGGSITLSSTEEETVFSIDIPKQTIS